MTAPILITGGTGTLGRHLLPLLAKTGAELRVLSRQRQAGRPGVTFMGGDLLTGEGVAAAVAGVGTIIHCAGAATGDDVATGNLVRAAARAKVDHLIYISVVGADRIPSEGGIDKAMFGYFGAKRKAEAMVAELGVPWTTLRATQFHDIILLVAEQMAKMPIIPVPAGFRVQPVDAGEVAARLVELAQGAPAGLVPAIAGPKIYRADELVRSYLRARGLWRPRLPLWLPGKGAAAFRAGANLAPERAVGRRSWEEFLAERLGAEGNGQPVAAR